jgi:hypothetical protein
MAKLGDPRINDAARMAWLSLGAVAFELLVALLFGYSIDLAP